MDFKVTHVGVYRSDAPPTPRWCIRRYTALNFIVGGVERLMEDCVDRRGQVPLLFLGREGSSMEVVFNARRENWVVVLEGVRFLPTSSAELLELHCGDQAFQMPGFVSVARELIPGWQREFEMMRQMWLEPTPRNRFRVEAGVMNALRYMADSQTPQADDTPAWKLKRLIDADLNFECNIEALSRSCGYSGDHLRMLFERNFNISPRDYRARRKLARALELMSDSSMGAKEIAGRLGFGHLPAFSSWFKRMSGITPTEAISRQRLRHDVPPDWSSGSFPPPSSSSSSICP